MTKYLYPFVLVALMFVSCDYELDSPSSPVSGTHSVALHIGQQACEVIGSDTRSVALKPLAALWYVVLDADKRIVDLPHSELAGDFSSLRLEGLRDGDYTISFLATTDSDANSYVSEWTELTDAWLSNPYENLPLNKDFLFAQISLTLGKGQESLSIPVKLSRSVGRVELDLKPANEFSLRFIRKISVSYDAGSVLPTWQNGDGSYGGEVILEDIDITDDRGFFCFPSVGRPLSGRIEVTAMQSDSTSFTRSYQFEQPAVEAGRISRIHIDWEHPEDTYGWVHLRASDLNSSNLFTMFGDDEPGTVIQSEARSFYINQPIKTTITSDHKLCVQFFSAQSINKVKLQCRFMKYSTEFFDFVQFDHLPAFAEITLSLPLTSGAQVFRASDGRLVEIPAQPNLKSSDCEFRIITDDPYMEKVRSIKTQMKFALIGLDNAGWLLPLTPYYCRQGVVLFTNVLFLFSSEEYAQMLRDNDYLLNDAGKHVPAEKLLQQCTLDRNMTLGYSDYNQGMASVGGNHMSLISYRLIDGYWDFYPTGNATGHTVFHEFGHIMGYGHNSDMTYTHPGGEAASRGTSWPTLCSRLMWTMGKAGKMPVNTKTLLN